MISHELSVPVQETEGPATSDLTSTHSMSLPGVYKLAATLPRPSERFDHIASMNDADFQRAAGVAYAIFKGGRYDTFAHQVDIASVAIDRQVDNSGKSLRQFHDVLLDISRQSIFTRSLLGDYPVVTGEARSQQLVNEFLTSLHQVHLMVERCLYHANPKVETQIRNIALLALLEEATNRISNPMAEVLKDAQVRTMLDIADGTEGVELTPRAAMDLVMSRIENAGAELLDEHHNEMLLSLAKKDATVGLVWFDRHLRELYRKLAASEKQIPDDAKRSFVKPLVLLAEIPEHSLFLALTSDGLRIGCACPDVHRGTTSFEARIPVNKALENTVEVGMMYSYDRSTPRQPDLRAVAKFMGALPADIFQLLAGQEEAIHQYLGTKEHWIGTPLPRLKRWLDDKEAVETSRVLLERLSGQPGISIAEGAVASHVVRCLASSPLLNSQCEGMLLRFVEDALFRGVRLEDARIPDNIGFRAERWLAGIKRAEGISNLDEYFRLDDGALVLTEKACTFIRNRLDPEQPHEKDRIDDSVGYAQRKFEQRW